MRKFVKWIILLLGTLLGLALLALGGLYAVFQSRVNQHYEVAVRPVTIPTDEASLARGRHVATLGFCGECHGDNYAGTIFDEGPVVGRLVVANLTTGAGGIGATYTDEDWVRAIRHGVDPEGKTVLGMDSVLYNHLSDRDLGALIAYLKSLPPVDNVLPQTRVGPLGMYFLLQEPEHFFPAAYIDHEAERPPDPAPGVTAEYGGYLARLMCTSCHGKDLAGGTQVYSGPNLTPGGELGGWSEADFLTAVTTGVRPDGAELDGEMMPWPQIAEGVSQEELQAIWLYLQSVPAVVSPPTPPPSS